MQEYKGAPTSRIFLQWSAIATVAAAIGRRVWTRTANSAVYANLFVLLVAPPGVGKTEGIKRAKELAEESGKMKTAPDDTTKASLLDAMYGCREIEILGELDLFEHCSMFLPLDELGTMIASHDMSMLSVISKLFDNPKSYIESRRGREGNLNIINPQLTLLAGTQPDFLANLLPPEAWGQGFMARMIMVYHGKPTKVSLFGDKKVHDVKYLTTSLTAFTNLYGEMVWTPEAEALLEAWYDNGCKPVPEHSKLKHYAARRIIYAIKLAMVSAVSRTGAMLIEDCDVKRGIDWLVEAEQLMPEIFKDMSGKSDDQVIQDLHHYIWQYFYKDGVPVAFHRAKMEMFLQTRTPTYNIENIIKSMVRARMLTDKGADYFELGEKSEMN